jgi:hypothetical protein
MGNTKRPRTPRHRLNRDEGLELEAKGMIIRDETVRRFFVSET